MVTAVMVVERSTGQQRVRTIMRHQAATVTTIGSGDVAYSVEVSPQSGCGSDALWLG